MAKAVVTGGAGFIGSHITDRLLKEGYDVTVLDNFSTGDEANVRHVIDGIELVEGDIRDVATVNRVVAGADVVFHEAALGSVARSVEDPVTSNDVNANGTLNMLVAARDAGVRRFVYASSSSVYGDTPTLPKHEEMSTAPKSPYAVTKLTAELYCRVFKSVYGLETYALRYFNVFGPRQSPNSIYAAVIPKFADALLNGEAPVIFGDGEQTRDFTFIDNVVDANIRAMKSDKGAGEAYNIGAGGQTSLNELLRIMQDLTETDVTPDYTETRQGDVRDSFADVQKAGRLIGYTPEISVGEGLKRTIDWYRNAELKHA